MLYANAFNKIFAELIALQFHVNSLGQLKLIGEYGGCAGAADARCEGMLPPVLPTTTTIDAPIKNAYRHCSLQC